MLEQFKPGITLFSILAIIANLFPPVVWKTSSTVLYKGFAFLLAIPNYKTTKTWGNNKFWSIIFRTIYNFNYFYSISN